MSVAVTNIRVRGPSAVTGQISEVQEPAVRFGTDGDGVVIVISLGETTTYAWLDGDAVELAAHAFAAAIEDANRASAPILRSVQ